MPTKKGSWRDKGKGDCFTRTNKSGASYVVCEGSKGQKGVYKKGAKPQPKTKSPVKKKTKLIKKPKTAESKKKIEAILRKKKEKEKKKKESKADKEENKEIRKEIKKEEEKIKETKRIRKLEPSITMDQSLKLRQKRLADLKKKLK